MYPNTPLNCKSLRRILTSQFNFPVTRSRAGTDQPLAASEPRKTRASVDREVLSQPAVTASPRRPIRGRRLSTDDHHEDTPPPARALRNRRVSVDRESATGTPKLGDESENGRQSTHVLLIIPD